MPTLPHDREKKKALKAQLKFRIIVLGQNAERKLFQYSEAGDDYSLEKLTENLKTLIAQSQLIGVNYCL